MGDDFLRHSVEVYVNNYSKAKASVPGAWNKLGDWLIDYAIFLHGLAEQWRPRKKQNLAQS